MLNVIFTWWKLCCISEEVSAKMSVNIISYDYSIYISYILQWIPNFLDSKFHVWIVFRNVSVPKSSVKMTRQSTPGTGNSNNYRASTLNSIQRRPIASMRNFPRTDDIEEKVGNRNNNNIKSHIRFDEISPKTSHRIRTDGSRGGEQYIWDVGGFTEVDSPTRVFEPGDKRECISLEEAVPVTWVFDPGK